jgi:hypothetical protein
VAPGRWIRFFLTAMLISALAGCNSGNTLNVQNPPPPPAAGLSIALQPTPPGSIAINSTTPITAVVTNDTSNGGSGSGVDWILTCQSGNCGSLLPPHTPSGQPVTYTPPSALSGNSEVVNVQGFATVDHTKNVLASINVTAFGNNLSGTYVLAAQGVAGGATYQFAGVMVFDGQGNITSGEQTVDFNDPATGAFVSNSGPIVPAGSSYFLGPDGRGTITINPNNPSNDPLIVPQTFSLVFLSSSHALITVTPTSALTISASGTMDMQASPITQPSAGYAFLVSGTDFSGLGPTAIGGILNIDHQNNNPNNISGTGSVADQNQSAIGAGLVNQPNPSGNVSFPDQFGAVTLTLNVPLFSTPVITFTGYIVDATHIQLIESDSGGAGDVAGLAIGQGPATGSFVNDAAFSGPYVFGVSGVDLANGQPDTLTSAGVVSPDGAGNLTDGYMDTAFQSLFSPTTGLPAQISGSFKGSYSGTTTGSGRFHSLLYGFANPNGPFQPVFIFYLTGNGNPALVLASGDSSFNFPFLGTGFAYPQSNTLTFSGAYGLNFTQQNGSESDGTAVMTVTPPSLSGVADVGPSVDQAFTSTVSSQNCSAVAAGCFAGSFANVAGSSAFQGNNAANPNAPVAFTADFYLIDQNHGFFIENDLLVQQQVSLGFFATETAPQTPSASGKSSKRRLR